MKPAVAGVFLACLFIGIFAGAGVLGAQESGAQRQETDRLTRRQPIINPPRTDGLWPGLRVYDAIYGVRLLQLQQFIMEVLPSGKRRTVRVRQADMRMVEPARLPPPYADGSYESRWDLLVNGQVIDPRKYAIYYDEKIINLGVLFTYGREFYAGEQGSRWLMD